jgi:hypothetical protein
MIDTSSFPVERLEPKYIWAHTGYVSPLAITGVNEIYILTLTIQGPCHGSHCHLPPPPKLICHGFEGTRTPAGVTESLKRWTNTEVDLPWVSMTGPNRRTGFM